MKVVMVYPYVTFVDVMLETLPTYLAKRGHEVHVIIYLRKPKEKMLYSRLKRERIEFHFVNAISISIPGLVSEFPYFLSLETLIRNLQPDVIHANNLPFLTTFQSMRMASKLKKAGIVHVHGVLAERNYILNIAQKMYIRTFGRSIFYNATKVICLTRNDASEISEYGCPIEKIDIIPNGVNVKKFRPNPDEEEGGLVLWLGRLTGEKGLIHLLKAIKIIADKKLKDGFNLLLVGDGPAKSQAIALAKKYALKGLVEFSPAVKHDIVPELLNRASIVVLPSLKEGMPFVLLEAMACGKPVIGSDIPGINNVITRGQNGLLVLPRNPKALANSILTLLNDEILRRRLGRNARQLMVKKYSWDTIASRIEKVYYEAIEEAKRS